MALKRALGNYTGKAKEIGGVDTIHPDSLGTGTASATTYLRGDSTWVTNPGITRSIIAISVNTTGAAAANTDYVYFCSGTITLTLPTAVGNTNIYTVKNISTGTITVAFTSTQTGDGSTTIQLTQNQSTDFISNNANFFII